MEVVIPLGEATDDVKNAAFTISSAVVLPVATGGGTNLKTAEALLTGLPIVSTSFAMRGFEKFSKLPYLFLADTATETEAALLSIMQNTDWSSL